MKLCYICYINTLDHCFSRVATRGRGSPAIRACARTIIITCLLRGKIAFIILENNYTNYAYITSKRNNKLEIVNTCQLCADSFGIHILGVKYMQLVASKARK